MPTWYTLPFTVADSEFSKRWGNYNWKRKIGCPGPPEDPLTNTEWGAWIWPLFNVIIWGFLNSSWEGKLDICLFCPIFLPNLPNLSKSHNLAKMKDSFKILECLGLTFSLFGAQFLVSDVNIRFLQD